MHVSFATGLIVSALVGALVLAMRSGDRLVPGIALVAAAIAALIDFRVIQISVARLRLDVVLPAVLTLAGAICWSRASAKSTTTAATVVTLAGLIMLLSATHVFRG
jgi:hypothetical protein